MKRRVVVTGIGIISPLGIGIEKNWKGIIEGRSGIRRITRFDATNFPVQIAGEVPDFNPEVFIEKKEIKKMDTFIQYALAASILAVQDAGLEVTSENAERIGVYIGSGIGGLPAIEHWHTVVEALESLNYSRTEVSRAMNYLKQEYAKTQITFDQLMRHALSFLSK